jgi:hypothetical protein
MAKPETAIPSRRFSSLVGFVSGSWTAGRSPATQPLLTPAHLQLPATPALVRGTLFLIFHQAGAGGWPAFWLAPGRHAAQAASAAVFIWQSLGAEKSAQQSHGICRKCRVTAQKRGYKGRPPRDPRSTALHLADRAVFRPSYTSPVLHHPSKPSKTPPLKTPLVSPARRRNPQRWRSKTPPPFRPSTRLRSPSLPR